MEVILKTLHYFSTLFAGGFTVGELAYRPPT